MISEKDALWQTKIDQAIKIIQTVTDPTLLKQVLKKLFEPFISDIDRKNAKGETFLIKACRAFNLPLIKFLLEELNANPNISNSASDTPLLIICKNEKLFNAENANEEAVALSIITLLITHGAKINYQNNDKITALYCSSCYSYNIAKFLLQRGADPNLISTNTLMSLEMTPLAIAVSQNIPLIPSLLAHQAKPNQIIQDASLLIILIRNYINYKKESKKLLKLMKDDEIGKKIVIENFQLEKKHYLNAIESFIKAGAKINQPNLNDNPLAVILESTDDPELLTLFVRYKADPNLPIEVNDSSERLPPFCFAAMRHRKRSIAYFLALKNIQTTLLDGTAMVADLATHFLKENDQPKVLNTIELIAKQTLQFKEIIQVILQLDSKPSSKTKQLVQVLKRCGCDFNQIKIEDLSLSAILISTEKLDLLNIFLESGLNLNHPEQNTMTNNAILYCIGKPKKNTLKLLLENELSRKQLATWCIDGLSFDCVITLLKDTELLRLIKKYFPDSIRKNQLNMLHVCVGHNFIEGVKQLLEWGVSLNARGPQGETPLYLACLQGHEEIAALLLEQPAIDTRIPGPDNFFPYQIAFSEKHDEIFKMLIKKECGDADLAELICEALVAERAQGGIPEMPLLKKTQSALLPKEIAFFPEADISIKAISARKYLQQLGITLKDKESSSNKGRVKLIGTTLISPTPTYTWFGNQLNSKETKGIQMIEGQLDNLFFYIDPSLFDPKNCDPDFLTRVQKKAVHLAAPQGAEGLKEIGPVPCMISYPGGSMMSKISREFKLKGAKGEERFLCCMVHSDDGKGLIYIAVAYLSQGFHSNVNLADYKHKTINLQLIAKDNGKEEVFDSNSNTMLKPK